MTGSGDGGGRLGRFGWAMFDWANQPLFTLISTFIFGPYFAATVVGNPVEGQALWGYAQSMAGLMIAVLSPVLGAIADQTGPRKPWIAAFQVVCIVASALLWFAVPNAPTGTLLLVMLAVVALTVGAECSIVFNNAMLPGLVPKDRIGRLSGSAWALGYLGGLVTLGIILGGFSLPEQPLFGLDKSTHEHARIVGPFTAVWIMLFIAPLFLFTPDTPRRTRDYDEAMRKGLKALVATLRELRHYRNILIFLLGRMASYDGLNALFVFGGIYAAGIFGWSITELGLFGILLNVIAAIGAFLGGRADDRFGSKITIQVATVGLMVAAFGIVSMTRDSVFFSIAVDGPNPNDGLFASTAERIFLVFGVIIGACGGPMQAASRTMMARLSPPEMIGEFYGLHALSGKATAFLAPAVIAALTQLSDSQRVGIASILAFLAVGFALTMLVREEQATKLGPA
ncbi:MFS transporter [Desertibaculum subflavum]|uniref:MFS transporter n=1 Tax=Desertibaculum subflavum TaxID=2268458 RepID=UPI000E674820